MSVLQEQQAVINKKAAMWTVIVHSILLFLFFLVTYMPPQVETVEELGMEVNLGTAADGFGTNQPMIPEEPAPDNAAATSMSSAASSDMPAEIVESNDEEAPAINTTKAKKSTAPNSTVINNTRSRTDRPANSNTTTPQKARYVYGGSNGTGGNNAAANAPGDNEGNTTGNGDRGVPGGTPGATNYEGTPGSGNGISHNISGRNIVAFPPREAEFKEGGQVTVRITVNRDGQITDKRIVSSSNAQLRSLALKKIESIRFNKSTTAPEEQFGNITFVFKTRS